MKKSLFLTFAAGILVSGTTMAFDEQFEDGLKDASQTLGQIRSAEKLQEAIKDRQYYYLKNKIRNGACKNRKPLHVWYK